jgi:hypothetical protein
MQKKLSSKERERASVARIFLTSNAIKYQSQKEDARVLLIIERQANISLFHGSENFIARCKSIFHQKKKEKKREKCSR